jgi:tetratricopeptide (TPR) repeat protein
LLETKRLLDRRSPSVALGRIMNRVFAAVASTLLLCMCVYLTAQVPIPGKLQINSTPTSAPQAQSGSDPRFAPDAEEELEKGTALTRRGLFGEAVLYLLAARGRVANEYAASFNLALCYVGTSQFEKAIQILNDLRIGGHDRVEVENLLTQAYIGKSQPQEALTSLRKAAALSPQNEKLYSFVADACMDHKDYSLGLEIVGIGLQNLPRSARLHYERAMFLTQLDQFDQAKPDFESAATLSPGSEIGYLAAAHEKLFEGNISEAVRIARESVKKGYENNALLTVLAEALIRSGISPGQPDFMEAQTVLEKAVTQYPNDPASEISLGSLYLMAGRLEEAIAHLEKANQLEPDDPSVYANLAKAYQRHGDTQRAQDALAVLQKLNREQADRISSAPGDRKLGYASRGVIDGEAAVQH